ncbi:uncharacterized protein BJ212DRAFT_1325415, partial [Suillus subaureus]
MHIISRTEFIDHSPAPANGFSTYLPYFVTFTTKPPCAVLAQEIAADATIAVSWSV